MRYALTLARILRFMARAKAKAASALAWRCSSEERNVAGSSKADRLSRLRLRCRVGATYNSAMAFNAISWRLVNMHCPTFVLLTLNTPFVSIFHCCAIIKRSLGVTRCHSYQER